MEPPCKVRAAQSLTGVGCFGRTPVDGRDRPRPCSPRLGRKSHRLGERRTARPWGRPRDQRRPRPEGDLKLKAGLGEARLFYVWREGNAGRAFNRRIGLGARSQNPSSRALCLPEPTRAGGDDLNVRLPARCQWRISTLLRHSAGP